MRKKALIIIAIIIVILIIGIVLFINHPKDSDNKTKKTTEEVATEKVDDFTKTIISDDITKEKLSKMTGAEIFSEDIMLGKETYLREKPKVAKEKIQEYINAGDKYATNVENQIKENFDYNIEKTITSMDKIATVSVKFKSYYYSWYLAELELIKDKILNHIGYSPKTGFDGNLDEESAATLYKAKIKAMEILDSHLNDYINKDEYMTFDIRYIPNNKEENKNWIMQYYSCLKGDYYPSTNIYTDAFQKKAADRVDKIIENAKQNKTLDSDDWLKLK